MIVASSHIIVIGQNGRLYDAFRFSDNTWVGFTDSLANARTLQTPGGLLPSRAISVAGMPNGDHHILAIGNDGRIYDAFRFSNNTWAGFTDTLASAGTLHTPGGLLPVRAISGAGLPNGDHHILAIGSDGRIYDAFRFANNTWAGFTDALASAGTLHTPGGLLPVRAISGAGLPDGSHHILAIGNDGKPYDAFRFANNTWVGFTDSLANAHTLAASNGLVPIVSVDLAALLAILPDPTPRPPDGRIHTYSCQVTGSDGQPNFVGPVLAYDEIGAEQQAILKVWGGTNADCQQMD